MVGMAVFWMAEQSAPVRRKAALKIIKAFVRERPGVCLLGALALGFVVGRIASRR